MMQMFATRQKSNKISNNNTNNNTNNALQTNQVNDYQILIGDNGFTPCTSQQSLCQSQQNSNENNNCDYSRNYITSPHILYLILFVIIYILLILLGASVFALFEQTTEFQLRDQLLRKQQTFLAKHGCIDADSLNSFIDSVINGLDNGINLSQLNRILKQAKLQNRNTGQSDIDSEDYATEDTRRSDGNDDEEDYKHKSGQKYNSIVKRETKESDNRYKHEKSEANSLKNIIILKNNSEDSGVVAFSAPTDDSNWEFTSSLLFVTSIVTTIGYGHITPVTPEGKVFCIIFSCIAIPFTLLFLSIIVSFLQNGPIKLFEKWLIKLITKYFRISMFFIRLLHLIIVTAILLFLILILPALLISHFEKNWTLLDSFYYCYISLTTVGLGDFVPAIAFVSDYTSLQIYRICVVIYLYSGLSMIMLWIALILRIPQLNFKTFLITEHEESDEHSMIIDYNKEIKPTNYGTEFSAQK